MNVVFLILYTTYLFIYKKYGSKVIFILFILIPIELAFDFNFNIKYNDYKINYGFNDNSIYRNKIDVRNNFGLYTNDNTISGYSSMIYHKTINFLSSMGLCTDGKSIVTYNYNTKLFDMLFNIKNNDYQLNKIYGVSNNILSYKYKDFEPFINQNNLVYSMTGIKNVLEETKLKQKINNNTITYTALKSNDYYFYLKVNVNYIITKDTIYVETNNHKILPKNYKKYHIKSYGDASLIKVSLKKGEKILVYYSDINSEKLSFFIINNQKLEKAYEYLKKYNIKYTSYKDNKIKGNIYLDDNMTIFISIPYDNNWNAYVDGKKVKIINLNSSLMGIKAKKGNHKIELVYKENNYISLMISLTTLVLFIIYLIKKRQK